MAENIEDKIESDKPNETAVIRDDKGLFQPGTAPGPGAPKQTEEEKEARKIRKEVAERIKEDYLMRLAESLPEIDPALIAKAKDGDVGAIKEVHDRVFGKAQGSLDVTSGGEKLNINLVQYGHHNPLEIRTETIPGEPTESPAKSEV